MDQPIFVMPFVVAIVSIVVFIGLPLLAWMLSRYFAHRERLEMIRHGYFLPASPSIPNASLRRGISLTFIGLALLIGLSFVGYTGGRFHLGPWLLGGLVPMLAGIAQIVIAFLGGARLHGWVHSGEHVEPAWPPQRSIERESEQKDRR